MTDKLKKRIKEICDLPAGQAVATIKRVRDPELLKVLIRYEGQNKDRVSVYEAAKRRGSYLLEKADAAAAKAAPAEPVDAELVEERPAVPALLQNPIELRTSRILQLHAQAEQALRTFSASVVLCGVQLLSLKKEIGHGKWEPYFTGNLERAGFSLRHAQRYMAAAKAVQAKIEAANPKAFHHSATTEDRAEIIHAALGDITDATTWQQLLLDFGIGREHKPKGGARQPAAGPKAIEPGESVQHLAAVEQWSRIKADLFDAVQERKTYGHLKAAELRDAYDLLRDAANELKECMNRG